MCVKCFRANYPELSLRMFGYTERFWDVWGKYRFRETPHGYKATLFDKALMGV